MVKKSEVLTELAIKIAEVRTRAHILELWAVEDSLERPYALLIEGARGARALEQEKERERSGEEEVGV